jgi:hypothetical protein
MNQIYNEEIERAMSLRHSDIYKDATDRVFEQKYSPLDINVEPYKITNWRKEGIKISGYKSEKEKRKKYNLIELVWLQMIQTMKELKIHSDHIINMSDFVWANIFDNSEALYNHPAFKKMLEGATQEQLNQIRAAMGGLYQSFLEGFVLDIILLGSNYSIILDKNGTILPCKESYLFSEIESILPIKEMMRRSHFSISINEALSKFLFEFAKPDEIASRLELISPNEYEVIKSARKQGVKSINLRFDNNGKIDLIETSKVIDPKRIEDANELKRLFYSESFKDIEIKTQNNKVIHVLERTKTKI